MSSKKRKKSNKEIIKYENNSISQERMIEIQAEAYYRALKRIEDEKERNSDTQNEKKKYKWYEDVQFILNVIFCPWKVNKKFSVSNRIYDSILVIVVSFAFVCAGTALWLIGMIGQLYIIYHTIEFGVTRDKFIVSTVMLYIILVGSILVLSGNEFNKETDSNKIYAYSASIIALISCIVSVIALIMT